MKRLLTMFSMLTYGEQAQFLHDHGNIHCISEKDIEYVIVCMHCILRHKKISRPEDIISDQSREAKLWTMLDNIDSSSDAIKPSDLAGYKRFYDATMKCVEERHQILESDGYVLRRIKT